MTIYQDTSTWKFKAKNCQSCGTQFFPKSGFQLYCNSCRQNPDGTPLAYCTKCKIRKRSPQSSRCATCNAEILNTKKTWRASVNTICTRCGRPKEIDGRAECGKCRPKSNEKAKRHRADFKRKLVEYMGSKCIDCGLVSEFHAVYDVHHLDPSQKEFYMARAKSVPWDSVKKELENCVLLCAVCHRIRHAKLNQRKDSEHECSSDIPAIHATDS